MNLLNEHKNFIANLTPNNSSNKYADLSKNVESKFPNEVLNILHSYLNENEFNSFLEKLITIKNKKSLAQDFIDRFYAEQLNIEYDLVKERIVIDRAVTLANKILNTKNYVMFLKSLGQLCIGHGKLNLAIEILNKALKKSKDTEDKAECLLLLSDVHSRKAEWGKSKNALDEAQKLFSSLNNQIKMAKCENLKGAVCGEKGELENAKQHFINSLTLLKGSSDIEITALNEANLGIIENIKGNYTEALTYFIKASNKLEMLKYHRRLAELKHNVAMLYLNQNKVDEALQAFDQCIEISLRENLFSVLAIAYLNKANAFIKKNELDLALLFVDKSMEIAHQIDDKLTIAEAYKTKSNIESQLKDYSNAETDLLTCAELNKKLNNIMNIAESFYELGKLYDLMNRNNEKQECFNKALTCFKEAQAPNDVQKVEEILIK